MIVAAAAEVDRPIFYAVAVIVAGFLPIYVLSGPSGKLFKPMADTMIFALVGSLVVTLTLLPVLCSWAMRKGVRERRNPLVRSHQISLHQRPGFLPGASLADHFRLSAVLPGVFAAAHPAVGAEFMPQLDEGALWVRATMPYTISFDESREDFPANPRYSALLPGSHHRRLEHGRPDDGTDPTGFFNVRVLCRPQALRRMDRRLSHQSRS